MTGLGRQAKVLSDIQQRTLLRHVERETDFPTRNRVIALLSFRAGLRAKEIAGISWRMLTDTEGQVSDSLALTNQASKGRSGRVIPLHTELRAAIVALHAHEESKGRGKADDLVVIFTKVLVRRSTAPRLMGGDPVDTPHSRVIFMWQSHMTRHGLLARRTGAR
jgi:integrase